MLTEKLAIVACYPDVVNGYRLVALKNNSAVAWKAEVLALATYNDQPRSGPPGCHRVELKEQDNLIYVFGADDWCVYLEAFEAATGKCRYRFTTRRWGKYWEPAIVRDGK